MYVCMSENLYLARLKQKKRNVFSARLNRSVYKSAERREDGRLPDPGSSLTYSLNYHGDALVVAELDFTDT